MVGHDCPAIITSKQANIIFNINARLKALSNGTLVIAVPELQIEIMHVTISLISVNLMSVGTI